MIASAPTAVAAALKPIAKYARDDRRIGVGADFSFATSGFFVDEDDGVVDTVDADGDDTVDVFADVDGAAASIFASTSATKSLVVA